MRNLLLYNFDLFYFTLFNFLFDKVQKQKGRSSFGRFDVWSWNLLECATVEIKWEEIGNYFLRRKC